MTTTKVKKAATFLTSDSLKEIRNKLRRLSDESLYKDDILISGASSTSSNCSQLSNGEHTVNKNATSPSSDQQQEDTPQVLQRRGSTSAFVNYRPTATGLAQVTPLQESSPAEMNKFQKSDSNSSVGSNSTSSSIRNEWRRKSYGFEKMTPPPETAMSHNCMESSTDSGIGRSGGDLNNQHQVQAAAQSVAAAAASSSSSASLAVGNNSTPKSNGTIVHISNPAVDNYQSYRSSFRNSLSASMATRADPKRHSIAVADDRRYLSESFKDSLSKPQASVNGFNVIFNNNSNSAVPAASTLNPVHHQQQQSSNSKRVEFCKTEVHFAPESGRVNIVETDGKPPPTNNFRRRRSSTQYLSSTSSSTESDYGVDGDQNQKLGDQSPITKALTEQCAIKPASVAMESRNEEEVRGILKNKPVKPKPYHLGENCADGESLFGVRLRPVSGDYTNWQPRPTTTASPSISLYKEPDSGEWSGVWAEREINGLQLVLFVHRNPIGLCREHEKCR